MRGGQAGWLLSAPALLLLAVAAAGPLLVVLLYSFLSKGPYGGAALPFTLDAWTALVVERDIFDGTLRPATAHLAIIWRSAWLALATTAVTFVLGLPTAWFIATRSPRSRPLWLFLITIPFWTNLLIRTFAILQIIRNEGIINGLLLRLGLIDRPLQILFTDWAVLIGMAYVYLPLMVLPLFAAIDRFDRRLLEAGFDLYAGRWTVLRRVVLPAIRPGVVAGCILVLIPALGAYVTPRVLGGGNNLMLGNFIELQFGQARNWPLGAALSMALLAATMVALLSYVRSTERGRGQGHG